MKLKPTTEDAYRLMHEGSLALAEVEAAGMRIDVAQLNRMMEKTKSEITELEEELKKDNVWRLWKRRYPNAKMDSRVQLGTILIDELGYEPTRYTSGGKSGKKRGKMDEEELEKVDHPFAKKYVLLQKLKKLHGTFLKGILREVQDGYLHPSYNLHFVWTFRSCVAKGTLIEVVRDVSEKPKGVPIEDVSVGDFVYCYDDNLNLVLKKVLWAGKTGRRKVVRLHWSARGKKGYLDVTPEHKIRLTNGTYVEAREFASCDDFRSSDASRHSPKKGVLALGRVKDRLFVTGQSKSILDHRFVFEQLIDDLKDGEIVHHLDENHLNNNPSNLHRTTLSEHASKWHEIRNTEESQERSRRTRLRKIADGHIVYARGPEHSEWLHVGKFRFLRMLSKAGGCLTKMPHDFAVLKRKAALIGIDLKAVKDRYTPDGRYISLGMLKEVSSLGFTAVRKQLGIGYYRLKRLCDSRGIQWEKRYANQFGTCEINNHKIIKVEWVEEETDVYDLEIEDEHNFIANEICVHNSCDTPNLQNQPIRNPLVAERVRTCFVPRDDHVILEIDYGALEFRGGACFWRDKAMVAYASDPSLDIHRDMAAECYMLDEVPKTARFYAKNQFVFPTLYGSFYKNTSKNLWNAIDMGELVTADGKPMKEHLADKGIKKLGRCDYDERAKKGTFEYHVMKVEEQFCDRFHQWNERKEVWWKRYLKTGQFRLMTGFVCSGVFTKNNLYNTPIQGPAFHLLLWSLIQTVKWIKRSKMRSRVVGQIHDSLILDVHKDELQDVLEKVKQIMTVDVRNHWDWVITPLEIEAEMAETNWYEKQEIEI